MKLTIKQLKSNVYSLLEVSTTKQVKKLFPEYDLRRTESWLAIEVQHRISLDRLFSSEAKVLVVPQERPMEQEFNHQAGVKLFEQAREEFMARISYAAADSWMAIAMDFAMSEGNNIVPFRR